MENKVEEYILGFEGDKKKILEEYRKIILESSELLKEKISWGMPTYYINKNIIHFAGNKNHVGIHPGADAIEKFKDDIKDFKYSKGTIQIKYSDEIPKKLILI